MSINKRKQRKQRKKTNKTNQNKKMAASSSFGAPLGSDYTFSELNEGADQGSGVQGAPVNNTGAFSRPISSVGGFGLSTLIASSRSGVVTGAQSASGGASVTLGGQRGAAAARFLIAATFDPTKAHVPVLFGDVHIRVENGAVTAYAADGPRASIPVDGDDVSVAFCDFGNGEKPGALVVRTKSTISIQRAEPTRLTLPTGQTGSFIVPIEYGSDVWLFYGGGDQIEADAAEIQHKVLSEVATLAAREAAMGARPSSLDRSVYGLMDTGATLYGSVAAVGQQEPGYGDYYSSQGSGQGQGQGSGYHYGQGSGYDYGQGSGRGDGYGSGAAWPRVWSSRDSPL
jgi:hypothetical protein